MCVSCARCCFAFFFCIQDKGQECYSYKSVWLWRTKSNRECEIFSFFPPTQFLYHFSMRHRLSFGKLIPPKGSIYLFSVHPKWSCFLSTSSFLIVLHKEGLADKSGWRKRGKAKQKEEVSGWLRGWQGRTPKDYPCHLFCDKNTSSDV